MTRIPTSAGKLLRRVMAILLAVGFLLPAQIATPRDEIRAAYAAQGLLCATDESGHRAPENHCVLCLVAACDTAASGLEIASLHRSAIDSGPLLEGLGATRSIPKIHRARAPPVLFA